MDGGQYGDYDDCEHPKNMKKINDDNWLRPGVKTIYYKKPEVLNAKNDCPWFEEKQEGQTE